MGKRKYESYRPGETSIHTVKLRELFLTFNINSLQVNQKDCKSIIFSGVRRKAAVVVFRRAMEIVIDDIIDNGTEFQFPNSEKGRYFMHLERITGSVYAKTRKRGAFKDYDPLETNFSAYRIEFYGDRKNGSKVYIPVHIDTKRSKRMATLAKQGKLKAGKVKAYQDYYNILQEEYPVLSIHDLYRILDFGFNAFRRFIEYGTDIMIQDRTLFVQTGIMSARKDKMLAYIIDKMKRKIRILYRRLHYIWDGYVYFSLSKERYAKIKELYEQNKVVDYGDVYIYKCYDEGFAWAFKGAALFKLKWDEEFPGFAKSVHLVSDKVELIETFDKWRLETIMLKNRKYMTILPRETSITQLYNKNRELYTKWLRSERWRKFKK